MEYKDESTVLGQWKNETKLSTSYFIFQGKIALKFCYYLVMWQKIFVAKVLVAKMSTAKSLTVKIPDTHSNNKELTWVIFEAHLEFKALANGLPSLYLNPSSASHWPTFRS